MAVYEAGHIVKICSLAEALPHGHRISAAILTYDCIMDNASLKPEQFGVENRNIIRAYANTEPEKAESGRDGRYVILELNLADADAPLMQTVGETGRRVTAGMDTTPMIWPGSGKGQEAKSAQAGGPDPKSDGQKGAGLSGPANPQKGGPQRSRSRVVMSENRVAVKQLQALKKADGEEIPAVDEWVASREGVTQGVEAFQVFWHGDIAYNLFIPQKMEAGKTYPLVFFVPDASVKGDDPLIVLTQGNGAMSFAAPTFQKKHPCFVLAPQIPEHYSARSDQGVAGMGTMHEKMKEILDEVCEAFPVDRGRLYNTGQSMGCILGFGMNICDPDLFAASLLVGGQWGELSTAAALKGQKIWMLNSDGDARAYPGMNSIAEVLEKEETSVYRFTLNARWPLAGQEEACRIAKESGAPVIYGTFTDQSVVPEGVFKSPVSNHMNTWPAAYQLDTVKEWLFAQRLDQ
ncbi:MAG: hypothetical protein LUC95_06490 [Lachnospiraceae bacterium]|nr:hypothetical protein [Lachnospiraceae bacterium]